MFNSGKWVRICDWLSAPRLCSRVCLSRPVSHTVPWSWEYLWEKKTRWTTYDRHCPVVTSSLLLSLKRVQSLHSLTYWAETWTFDKKIWEEVKDHAMNHGTRDSRHAKQTALWITEQTRVANILVDTKRRKLWRLVRTRLTLQVTVRKGHGASPLRNA